MRSAGRHLPRLAIPALLLALLPWLAPEGHGPSEHPVAAGCDEGTVSYSAHADAERGLHIESVTAVDASRCPGCLLPKKQASDRARRPASGPTVAPGPPPAGPREPLPAGPAHSPASPRAPPVS